MYDYAVGAAGLTAWHSADDLAQLISPERTPLSRPGLEPGSPLHRAMMRPIRSVELALGWFRFAKAIKRRDSVATLFQVSGSPAHSKHIGGQGLRAVLRVLAQGKRRKYA